VALSADKPRTVYRLGVPSMIGARSVGYSSGLYSRSASWMMMTSPPHFFKPGPQRRAFALVFFMIDNRNFRIIDLFQNSARSITGAIIHDDDLAPVVQTAEGRMLYPIDNFEKRLFFVIDRNDNRYFHGRWSPFVSGR